MKNLQQFCAATALTLAFTLSALGGEMGFPGVTAQGVMQTPGASAAGDMQFPGVSSTADPLTEMVLGFLLNLSSLL